MLLKKFKLTLLIHILSPLPNTVNEYTVVEVIDMMSDNISLVNLCSINSLG